MHIAANHWFNAKNLTKYSGFWVAISDNKLIAKDSNPEKLIQKIKGYKDGNPTVMRIPKKNEISIL
jgi:hypothetical protein